MYDEEEEGEATGGGVDGGMWLQESPGVGGKSRDMIGRPRE